MNDPQPEGHMASYSGRRKFLATLGGAAVAWPLAARAQQPERMRRIGFLHGLVENDPEAQARIKAFRQGLEALGWTCWNRSKLTQIDRSRASPWLWQPDRVPAARDIIEKLHREAVKTM